MAPRSPEGLIPLLLKAAAGHHQLGGSAEVEGKVFNAGHKRRGLDQKQGMVIMGAGGSQEGADVGEAIGTDKAQPLIKGFARAASGTK